MFRVLLKPTHPTGVYRRAGMQFVRGQPVEMNVVPTAIRKDEWLVVSVVEQKKERDHDGDKGGGEAPKGGSAAKFTAEPK